MSQRNPKRAPSSTLWLLLAAVALVAFSGRHALLDQDPRIAPRELLAALEGADAPLVLDVRTPDEYRAGHVPGAVRLEQRRLEAFAAGVADKDRPLVLYCETGARSRAARYRLRDLGFTDLTQLQGDMVGWRRLGLPVSRPAPAG